jgi:hypothetical protein
MEPQFDNLDFIVLVFKKPEGFLAYTPTYEICASGPTADEAKTNLATGIVSEFKSMARHGTLESTLTDLGWTSENGRWTQPELIAHTTESYRVRIG